MSQDNFTTTTEQANDGFNNNVPTPPRKSDPFATILICFVCLTLGLGGGLAAMYATPGKTTGSPKTASSAKDRLEILSWFVGDDSKKSKKRKSRKKKKGYGPFDSVFGEPDIDFSTENYKSPLETTPTISF